MDDEAIDGELDRAINSHSGYFDGVPADDQDHDADAGDDILAPTHSLENTTLLPSPEHEFVVIASPVSERGLVTPVMNQGFEHYVKSTQSTTWRASSVYWLLPPFLLYCIAIGAVSVPKLNVFLALICRQNGFTDTGLNGHEDPRCQVAGVQSLLARFTLYANLISGTLCAITSPKLGAMSDRYGRKPIMAVTAMGMLIGDIITITAASFPDTISVYWILLEYALGGLVGAFIATMAIAQAYAADCTPPAERSVVFGWVHGCYYIGIALGPALGGFIIKALDNILSIFYVAFACHLAFILFLLFLLPESLSREQRQAAKETHRRDYQNSSKSSLTKLNPAKAVAPLKILRPVREESTGTVRTNLIFLSAIDTVVFGVGLGSASVVVMYSEYMFEWSNFEASVFVSITNTCRVAMLLLILPLIFRIFNHHGKTENDSSPISEIPGADSDALNISIIRFSVLFDVFGYLGYATMRTGTLFTISGVIASIGGIASPTLQSTLTSHVPAGRTGQLFGAIGLLHALSRIVAPLAFHLIYSFTVGRFTQLVFWCLVVTFGLAFGASWGIKPRTNENLTYISLNNRR